MTSEWDFDGMEVTSDNMYQIPKKMRVRKYRRKTSKTFILIILAIIPIFIINMFLLR